MNHFDLQGRVVLVTGGNGGIGLGIAKAVAAAGASVVIWGRNDDKNRSAVAELMASGGRAEVVAVDVANEVDVSRGMDALVEAHGRIDAVFANAGVVSEAIPFLEQTRAEWDRVFEINLFGVVNTFRAGIRHMLRGYSSPGTGGSLVAITSPAALRGAAMLEP